MLLQTPSVSILFLFQFKNRTTPAVSWHPATKPVSAIMRLVGMTVAERRIRHGCENMVRVSWC